MTRKKKHKPITPEKLEAMLRSQDWRGRCYACAFLFAWLQDLRGRSPMLVHGTCHTILNGPVDHAWVELDGEIWDVTKSLESPFSKQLWEKLKPIQRQRYSFPEATALAVKTEHYGPWTGELQEEELCLPRGDRSLERRSA